MYCKFFSFAEKPFDVTPDPRFLFLTESHQEALSSMIYGIRERRGFISISGEVGTGKTTLIHHLLHNLDRKVKAVFLYQTQIPFEQLLKEILLELELPVGDGSKASLTRQLQEYLIQRLARDENLAILIDEAQNLSKEVMEELRMLSNLETPGSKLLQIVFVGQPELEAKLNSDDLRQLKQRIGIRRKIRPLTQEESRQYIDHRLRLVGSSSSEVFTPEAGSMICRHSKGIPRTINIVCDSAFLIGYGISRKKIDAKIIREVISDLDSLAHRYQSTAHSKSRGPSTMDSGRLTLHRGRRTISRFGLAGHRRARPIHSRASVFILVILCLGLGFALSQKKIYSLLDNLRGRPAIIQPVNTRSSAEPFPAIKTGLASNVALITPPEPNRAAPEPTRLIPVSPVPKASPEAEGRLKKIIAVGKGDSISSLSQRYYNLANITLMDLILECNPGITNVHVIKPGQKIKIPEITEASLIIPWTDDTWKIHLGTFSKPESARTYKDEPALKGKEIEIIPHQVSPEETWHRVVAGKFDTRDEALKTVQALKEKGMLPSFRKP
jgi:general secretion pathway protein A